MNKTNQIYYRWKEHKRNTTVKKNFCDDIMKEIYDFKQSQNQESQYTPIHNLLNSTFAKAAVLTAAAISGFLRIIVIIYLIFEV